jgi:predicted DCC family thiol-disulfide oxidoreductase YuxK
MTWAALPAPDIKRDIILFDGDCVLCSRWARRVHEADKAGRFAFVAIRSPAGRALAARFGIDPEHPQTNIAIVDGVAHFKLDAARAVFAALPGFNWLAPSGAIPKPARDWFYDRVARNRYRLFGRKENCLAPDAAMRARVIENMEDLTL